MTDFLFQEKLKELYPGLTTEELEEITENLRQLFQFLIDQEREEGGDEYE